MSYVNTFFRRLRSSHIPLTDRNWSIAVGVGKNFGWDAAASVRPQPKIRRKNCEIPSPARTPSRGPSALVLYTKNTRRTQKSTFPDLPERVWTADAGHTTQPPAEKISNLFDTFIGRLWVGGSGRTFSDCLFPTLLPFRIDADLSLLSYHVSGQALITC